MTPRTHRNPSAETRCRRPPVLMSLITVSIPRTYNSCRRRGSEPRRTEVRSSVREVTADRRWSQRLVAGDESALREAYREHGAALLGLATRVLGNAASVEDIVQEVFVGLWERPERFDPTRGRLRTYLLALTHSRVVDRLRADDSQRRRLDEAGRQPPRAHTPDPTEAVEDRLARAAVRRALDELPHEQRTAIELAYFGGLPYREVAVVLGEPEGTVRYRIRSGMQKMRAALQAEEVTP